MPTVLRIRGYRIYFYSHEPNEPPHVHIDRDQMSAKFWLEPVGLAGNRGFSSRELRQIEKIVEQNRSKFLEDWNEHFGNG